MMDVEDFNLPVADRKRIIHCLAEDVLYIHGVDAFFGESMCNCKIDYWKGQVVSSWGVWGVLTGEIIVK